MNKDYIIKNIEKIFNEIPNYVNVVAVIKNRNIEEIDLAIKGGIKILGINYVKDGLNIYNFFKNKTEFHLIGHLQSNKISKAIKIFDKIQTIDSIELSYEINEKLKKEDKILPIFIEINIAKEKSKFGINPEYIYEFSEKLSNFDNLVIEGLMTMGPNVPDKEIIRKYFKETRIIFENLKKLNYKNFNLKYLSMGMSDSYRIAIEEGSNMIRIGRKIFEKNE
ncbi:MAG: YggS family pyridoxal phosphate-dependent enzyme [Caldisericia bacterium]|nr:YggS family pyridoxal phosphate-dependent enzyme [Caldisericia bacterium]